MKFYIYPGDGTPTRAAERIRFIREAETTYTLTAARDGFTVLSADEHVHVPNDVDRAAAEVARIFGLCRSHSIVIDSSSTELRGDETRTADVYPPGQQPRIKIERPR